MKIDIIIPAYNAHDTIGRTLASIACQTIIDDIEVLIVDDYSDKDYSEFIERFSPIMKIKEIKLKKNMGPGYARQYGMDNTSNPLITFIDADDTFSGAFALKELRKALLMDPTFVVTAGAFIEEHENSQYILHNQDMIWVFGKMYKRSFLTKYNIRFNDTRANEDNGFNTLIRLCSNEQEKINFIRDTVYYWHMRANSITRVNNCEYSYNQSFVGYVDNMIYAIKEARKRNPFNGAVNLQCVQTLCSLYEYYIETVARDPRFIDQNFACCVKFYKEVYSEIADYITDQILAESYSRCMKECADKLIGIIPSIGIYEFLNKLKESSKGVNNNEDSSK